ncbi:putative DNA-binding protein [Desulfosarcina variabilis str. Montpellier]|uniref:helix-turn-helix domain-containing protein n=1 Tax=Desulfosarcina variabilis TaxID=2300 RepID=UPI003AFB5779
MISVEIEEKLAQLGRRLRDARLKRNEPQREFAVRLGVSIPTLRKMETGDASVSIGLWIDALELLGHLGDIDHLLAPRQSLFEQYDAKKAKTRQRASKRKGL